jgi:membrane associated rhomboid family serine protease
MPVSSRSYARGYSSSGALPPAVKWLLISNTLLFVLYFLAERTAAAEIFTYLALVPAAVVRLGFVWQLATYMFLHGGFFHILWNMLSLWMFGVELERTWGTRQFLKYYFFCGVGAGLCVVAGNYWLGDPRTPTIGSSGAIYGILMAYAILFPDRQILFSFLFPIKVKYFVMIIGAIAFLNTFKSINSGVSDVAHLGGLAFGLLFLKAPRLALADPTLFLRERYREWKLRRAKKKFQVYLRKQGSGDGRFRD